MSVTKDVMKSIVNAQTEARIRDIVDKQRIENENYENFLRIQREESQYAQRKQTQTANINAFQVEKRAEVGIAGANALGQMGTNGVGNVNIGGDGTGFNMAGMMASMAIGGVVGQNIADTMNNIMGNINSQTTYTATPPVIPWVEYYVAVNGQANGPYDISTLTQMIRNGQLTTESLVWKNGMQQWVRIEVVEELRNLFSSIPPIP